MFLPHVGGYRAAVAKVTPPTSAKGAAIPKCRTLGTLQQNDGGKVFTGLHGGGPRSRTVWALRDKSRGFADGADDIAHVHSGWLGQVVIG